MGVVGSASRIYVCRFVDEHRKGHQLVGTAKFVVINFLANSVNAKRIIFVQLLTYFMESGMLLFLYNRPS